MLLNQYNQKYSQVPCCTQVEFDENGKANGVNSKGETTKCKKVVCDPSYLSDKVRFL